MLKGEWTSYKKGLFWQRVHFVHEKSRKERKGTKTVKKHILPIGSVICVVQLLLLGGQLLADRDQSPGRFLKLSPSKRHRQLEKEYQGSVFVL